MRDLSRWIVPSYSGTSLMDFGCLMPKELYALRSYYLPTKDQKNALLDSLPWERLCAWYFIFGYSRVVQPISIPEVLVEKLFEGIELRPGVFCSVFASAVIAERSDLVVEDVQSALYALGWYYLIGTC